MNTMSLLGAAIVTLVDWRCIAHMHVHINDFSSMYTSMTWVAAANQNVVLPLTLARHQMSTSPTRLLPSDIGSNPNLTCTSAPHRDSAAAQRTIQCWQILTMLKDHYCNLQPCNSWQDLQLPDEPLSPSVIHGWSNLHIFACRNATRVSPQGLHKQYVSCGSRGTSICHDPEPANYSHWLISDWPADLHATRTKHQMSCGWSIAYMDIYTQTSD